MSPVGIGFGVVYRLGGVELAARPVTPCHALSSKDVHIAYRVRLDDVVTFPWLPTVTDPVPLAAEFQPLNTYLSRVKTFALTAVETPWGTVC